MSTEQQVTDEVLTPSNVITAIRLALLPVFLVLLVGYQNNQAAFVVLLLAALTDLIDGQLARFTNTVSELGILLDPFVDRYFILSAILGLFAINRLPLWQLVLLVLRDFILLILNVILRQKNKPVFKVVLLGKMATAALMAGFCSMVLLWPIIPGFGLIESDLLPGLGAASAALGYSLVYIGLIFSYSSALYYVFHGLSAATEKQPGNETEIVTTSAFSQEAEIERAGDA